MLPNITALKQRTYKCLLVFFVITAIISSSLKGNAQIKSFEFYNETFNFHLDSSVIVTVDKKVSSAQVSQFYTQISASKYDDLISSLKEYQQKFKLNDWICYQLIRKTAEQISPKNDNYFRYTLYKWFLLSKCGFDARLAVGNNQVIFYVRNEEEIKDIPFFMLGDKKYMCLNYHDYGRLFERSDAYKPVNIFFTEAQNPFSYKVTRLPDFKPEDYEEKDVQFSYKQTIYHFKLQVNNDIQAIFKNYPGVDFETYFNIPLSKKTYSSLIPILKTNLKGLDEKKGVDYLMRFTRYAFLYEDDDQNFGKEKRLSPEETLFNKYSDCDDRAALFFYLVKEIYNLPMIALLYPTHLTMAVQFNKPIGKSIIYKGQKYSFCEPTPQLQDLKIGEVSNKLRNVKYEVVYAYEPIKK
ncbi:hypothetical protein [Pedobacter mucosus]|uniref:hypothetical protein n=1 Tax=Pedobacter mucosus TaxID=2895286 RepID=UPI001EE4879B|nr:hypothetical protein [Pedobacter mucosus]UKT62384.1 hypothetical protein LOK61_11500 [Pedobacter mucosus]